MAVGFKALAMVLKSLLRFSLSKLFLLSLSSHLPHDIFWLLNQILPHIEESAHLYEGPLISSATDYWPQSFLHMNTKSTEERHVLDDLWCRENYKHTHTHLFVTLLLPSLFQGESSQLIGSLLHQVDIADWIGQGFNDVWGQGRKEWWWRKNSISFSVFLLSCDHLTYLQMCLGHSLLLQHTQTEQVTSGTGSSHSSDWCSDSLQGLG